MTASPAVSRSGRRADRMAVCLEPTPVERFPVIAGRWGNLAAIRRWIGALDPALLSRSRGETGAGNLGASVTGLHSYIATTREPRLPVAVVLVQTYDRWAVEAPEGSPVVLDSRPTASLGLAVDPAWRRHGVGRAVLEAIPARPELGAIELFVFAIDPANHAASHAAVAAGWEKPNDGSAWEGLVWYRRTRVQG